MNSAPSSPPQGWVWICAVLVAGTIARFWAGTLGHNFDFDSYRVVADLMAQGKNVYASTDRYNYGPVWFTVIHALDVLARLRWIFFARC